MLHTRDRVQLSPDTLLLAAADRLFAEFDELPAYDVFAAFSATRTALRERGVESPTAQQIEHGVRTRLCELQHAR